MNVISEETVLRANQRMMECKVERNGVYSASRTIRVSVFANGRVYKQKVTDREIRKAFEKALKSSNVTIFPDSVFASNMRIKKVTLGLHIDN